jgi:diguanylate cyclase (GGDEF)-like protein
LEKVAEGQDSGQLEPSSALGAIERERYRSYSYLARNLHWLAAALVLLYAVLTPSNERLVLYGLAGSMVVYTLILHSPLLERFSFTGRLWVEATIDLGWVSAVVLFTRSGESPFFFLYYMVLFAGMPSASRRATYLKAGVASVFAIVAIVALAPDRPAWSVGFALSDLVWPLTGLWLVAYFTAESGSLGAALQRSLFMAAHTDGLTGLPNMRYFTAAADLRGKLDEPYAIVMIDADNLKKTNDTYGHAVGNELIKGVANALQSAARSTDDLCSRLGGDEFIVRLNGATAEGALAFCRRVRAYLEAHPLDVGKQVLPISISTGVAASPEHGRTLSEITQRADDALYRSKRHGRGRDEAWTGPTASGILPTIART